MNGRTHKMACQASLSEEDIAEVIEDGQVSH